VRLLVALRVRQVEPELDVVDVGEGLDSGRRQHVEVALAGLEVVQAALEVVAERRLVRVGRLDVGAPRRVSSGQRGRDRSQIETGRGVAAAAQQRCRWRGESARSRGDEAQGEHEGEPAADRRTARTRAAARADRATAVHLSSPSRPLRSNVDPRAGERPSGTAKTAAHLLERPTTYA
jgi:hypothetical protein